MLLLTEQIKQHQITNNKQQTLDKQHKQPASSCLIVSAYHMFKFRATQQEPEDFSNLINGLASQA